MRYFLPVIYIHNQQEGHKIRFSLFLKKLIFFLHMGCAHQGHFKGSLYLTKNKRKKNTKKNFFAGWPMVCIAQVPISWFIAFGRECYAWLGANHPTLPMFSSQISPGTHLELCRLWLCLQSHTIDPFPNQIASDTRTRTSDLRISCPEQRSGVMIPYPKRRDRVKILSALLVLYRLFATHV